MPFVHPDTPPPTTPECTSCIVSTVLHHHLRPTPYNSTPHRIALSAPWSCLTHSPNSGHTPELVHNSHQHNPPKPQCTSCTPAPPGPLRSAHALRSQPPTPEFVGPAGPTVPFVHPASTEAHCDPLPHSQVHPYYYHALCTFRECLSHHPAPMHFVHCASTKLTQCASMQLCWPCVVQ